MVQKEIIEKIQTLVEKYNKFSESERKGFNEEQTKNFFIRPLFEALGWDFANEKEVSFEESVAGKRADYEFRLNDIPKFYLEAKAIRADLESEQYSRQAINYAWNKGVDWAVLTDFEGIKLYNAQSDSKKLSDRLVFDIHYSDYISKLDKLELLSKDSFLNNKLEEYAIDIGKKIKKMTVNEKLFADLKEAREKLTKAFGSWTANKLDQETLDEGVQRILDRLVFIRVLEDKGLEKNILRESLNSWVSQGKKEQFFQLLISKFRELDHIYNSSLFKEHACETWEEYDSKMWPQIISSLYGSDMFQYDFKEIPADILGGVYEGYLGYIGQNPINVGFSKGKLFEIDDKSEIKMKSRKKRKEHGIYYTPKFIVDYIVKNTLGEKLKEIKTINELKQIKVLDPACGSGSFITEALEEINNKYIEFGSPGDQATKTTILAENIYGVDLDAQAVELARLNLLLRTLDTKAKLPTPEHIKNGNSLISGSEEELKKYFRETWREKKPFNWEEEYPEVFKQGGFDVIIGNPPYVNLANIKDESEREWLKDKYETAKNKSDLYSFFTERATKLLKPGGVLGLIFSNSWLGTDSFSKFREFLINNTTIYEMVKLPPGVFKDALVTTVLIFIKNEKPKEKHKIKLLECVDNKMQTIGDLSYERIKNTPNFCFSFNQEIKFNIETVRLGDVAKFSLGIKTSDDKRFIFDEKKDNDSYELLRGKDVCRYQYHYNNKWIWYKPELMMEKVGAGPRKLEYFLRSKILFRSITGGSIMAMYDDNNYLVNDKVHILYESSNYLLKYILGIVNSKLIDFWIKSNFNNLLEIKINQLQEIPIPKIDFSNNGEKEKHDYLADLADKILDLNKKLQQTPEKTEKYDSLKSEIEKIDKLIDQKVYELYGLTEEEIKMVEGNFI